MSFRHLITEEEARIKVREHLNLFDRNQLEDLLTVLTEQEYQVVSEEEYIDLLGGL